MPDTLWEVQIQGYAGDLEHLARHFTSPPLVVSRDDRDGSYLLQCDDFRLLTASEAVLSAADEHLSVLTGVLKFVLQSEEPLRSGGVYIQHADGRRDVFVHIREGVHARVEVGEVTVSVADSNGVVRTAVPPPPRSVSLAQLAMRDSSVAKALRLLGTDAKNWVGMYRLHEVVEADVGGERAMIKHGWGSSRQLKRFKRSANSVTVAGDAARHGKELEKPPVDPMSLDEAEAYVTYVLHAWFNSKGA